MLKEAGARLSVVLVAVFVLVSLSGCSVFMAAKQPGKKDMSVLDVGRPRAEVIAELGSPQWSEEKDGARKDIFTFVQGYNTATKTGRALFHGAADVFTFGLWEVVGTPTEAIFNGKTMKVEVVYDATDHVKEVNYLNQK